MRGGSSVDCVDVVRAAEQTSSKFLSWPQYLIRAVTLQIGVLLRSCLRLTETPPITTTIDLLTRPDVPNTMKSD